MHDGAPPHFLLIVRPREPTFGERWIGRGGPVNWPTRSPDLNPLDFWLWEHLKALIYSAPMNDSEGLQERVENACQETWVKPGTFDRVSTSVRRRAESYIEMHGNHTKYLLWRSHERYPYLSRRWFLDVILAGNFLLI
jgi:hypothetical protein